MRARRTTVEFALASTADDEPGISVKRGVRAKLDGSWTSEEMARARQEADLVVDASGAHRPDSAAPANQLACLTWWYRSSASVPVEGARARLGWAYASLTPGDADAVSVSLVLHRSDDLLRLLKAPGATYRFAELIEQFAPTLTDATPVGVVAHMPRFRTGLHVDECSGSPVVPVGDAAMTTNPLLTRGLALGFWSARTLALATRTAPLQDVPAAYHAAAAPHLCAWYDESVRYDTEFVLWLRAARGDRLTSAESALLASPAGSVYRHAALARDSRTTDVFVRYLHTLTNPSAVRDVAVPPGVIPSDEVLDREMVRRALL